MIVFTSKGNLDKTKHLLESITKKEYYAILDKYGAKCVDILSKATPIDTGKTASSWKYEIVYEKDSVSIIISNTNVHNGVNIALIIQNGHGTRTGGYVEGIDYINPALKPIFDEIVDEVWKEVRKR